MVVYGSVNTTFPAAGGSGEILPIYTPPAGKTFSLGSAQLLASSALTFLGGVPATVLLMDQNNDAIGGGTISTAAGGVIALLTFPIVIPLAALKAVFNNVEDGEISIAYQGSIS